MLQFDAGVFRRRLSGLIAESGETVPSLAQKACLAPAAIVSYANGTAVPRLPVIFALAALFRVNPVWLFGLDVQKSLSPRVCRERFGALQPKAGSEFKITSGEEE